MKTIGYLINIYPMTSQTFIRREIAAIETAGVIVRRYAVRPWDTPLVDPEDLAEAARTRYILENHTSLVRLLVAAAVAALIRPRRFARALAGAWRLGGAAGSERGRVPHLAYLAEACVLKDWAARDGVTHIHAHFGHHPAALALFCRLLGGPTYSFTVHGPEEFDHALGSSLGEKIHHADFVVAITSFARSQLWRWAAFADWGKVHVVHCAVDYAYLEAPATPCPDTPRLINIGRFVEQKGQLVLVEAAARLRDTGRSFEIVLVGDGPFRPELERRVASLGLERCVRFAGWLTGEQVKSALLGSRALVLPSFAEGLPVVIMESLALRRPVISTYVAGIPELVRPGETGWLVPAGDVVVLARVMAEVLDAPSEQLDRMGEAGAAQVAREHDAAAEARKLLALMGVAGHLSGPGRPAVFLDRDGTIIEEVHYLSDPARLRVLPGAARAIRALRAAGYACIVVSNQSAIGRGMITEAQLHAIHDELARQLAAEEAVLDAIYFCPDAPSPADDDPTLVASSDRKPGPGMFLRAAREHGLDLGASWSVGDMLRDVRAGHVAGCRDNILVQTGKGRTQVEAAAASGLAHHVVTDLSAAAALILATCPPRDREDLEDTPCRTLRT